MTPQQRYYLANKEQIAAKRRERYRKNRELELEKNRQWREAHREEFVAMRRIATKAWKEANPERTREHSRKANQKRRQLQPEKARAYVRAAKQASPQHYREYTNKWRRDNAEKVAEYRHRRRTKMSGSSFTAEEWISLKTQYGNKCLRCGTSEDTRKLTPDHVVPIALGGSNDISNIQPLCSSCNSRKHIKVVDYRVSSTHTF